jgi:hypothetical protein
MSSQDPTRKVIALMRPFTVALLHGRSNEWLRISESILLCPYRWLRWHGFDAGSNRVAGSNSIALQHRNRDSAPDRYANPGIDVYLLPV